MSSGAARNQERHYRESDNDTLSRSAELLVERPWIPVLQASKHWSNPKLDAPPIHYLVEKCKFVNPKCAAQGNAQHI